MSLSQLLSLSQSSTVGQNVRPWSGKDQNVLASQLDFDAAQYLALNQRASLCSGLTKMYPEQQKHVQKQNQQQCPGQGGLPATSHADSKGRDCLDLRLQIKPGE